LTMEKGNDQPGNENGPRGDFIEEHIKLPETPLSSAAKLQTELEPPSISAASGSRQQKIKNQLSPDESPPLEPYAGTSAARDLSQELDSPSDEPDQITSAQVIEAILFAGDEPITGKKLAEMVGTGGISQIKQHIEQLNEKYQRMNCAFRIEAIAGGYQMLTLSKFNIWLRKLVKVRQETKLTPAALETLAIIAYKQPIIRVDVEAIRGVGCGEMIRQLCEKGMVKIVGRAEVLGRPLLYGTTRKFLEVFGINSLKELPQAEQLKPPY